VCRVLCVCQTRLKLSCKVKECKPLPGGHQLPGEPKHGRGLHSFTLQLNLCTFCGIRWVLSVAQ